MDAPDFEVQPNAVLVSWTEPSPLPGVILRYDLVNNLNDGSSGGNLLYSGNSTTVTLQRPVDLDFRVRAVTAAGEGPYSSSSVIVSSTSDAQLVSRPEFYAPIAAGLALLLIIIFVVVRKYREQRRKASALAFVAPKADEWERDPTQVTLGRKLGQGNFGIVYSAAATNITEDKPGTTSVAVKMIAPDATAEEKRAFLEEANIMKKFSKPWNDNVCQFWLTIFTFMRGRSSVCWGSARRQIS
jgi:hypothetical protein